MTVKELKRLVLQIPFIPDLIARLPYSKFRRTTPTLSKEEKKKIKKEKRKQRFFSDGWQHDKNVSKRNYSDYQNYIQHQVAKLEIVYDSLKEDEENSLKEFCNRLSTCDDLKLGKSVLCLGARIGTEAKAFISLGHFAVGIDLNPGPQNEYVLPGDFHRLIFNDATVDVVYTNCLDHAYDLQAVAAEIRRVLQPDGIFIMDIYNGYEEEFFAGAYESMHWPTAKQFAETFSEISSLQLTSFRSLAGVGRPDMKQAVFKFSARLED